MIKLHQFMHTMFFFAPFCSFEIVVKSGIAKILEVASPSRKKIKFSIGGDLDNKENAPSSNEDIVVATSPLMDFLEEVAVPAIVPMGQVPAVLSPKKKHNTTIGKLSVYSTTSSSSSSTQEVRITKHHSNEYLRSDDHSKSCSVTLGGNFSQSEEYIDCKPNTPLVDAESEDDEMFFGKGKANRVSLLARKSLKWRLDDTTQASLFGPVK